MALSKRLALLGVLSVTKPRCLGSSCGLINRRQFSNLTKDSKFGPKVSSDQALAKFRHEAEKLQAPVRESEFKPKRSLDQAWADLEFQSAKFKGQ